MVPGDKNSSMGYSSRKDKPVMTIEGESEVYKFNECDKKQEEYKEAFKAWLLSRSNIKRVWDATFQEDKEESIDIWAETSDDNEISFQVKVDFKAQNTGNIVFEIVSQAYRPDDAKESKIGWGLKLDSVDYIAFVVVGNGDIYIFRPQVLVNWVFDNMNHLMGFRAKNPGYVTLGVRPPIHEIERVAFGKGNIDDAIPLSREEE